MATEIQVTQAGSILSQEISEAPSMVAADVTYNLASIEIGSSEPEGRGYITMVVVSDTGQRTAYTLPNAALPDVASLILGFVDAHHSPSG